MPHQVRVRAGHPDLVLEDGTTLHQPGDVITLSDEAYARLPQSVFGTVLDDLGEVGAPTGGSSQVGAPCWFQNADSPTISIGGSAVSPQLVAITDGIAAGTDLVVDDTDPTAARCVTPGTYLVTAEAGVPNSWTDWDRYLVKVKKNDDSVGPEYYAYGNTGKATLAEAHVPMMPVVLQENDLLRVTISAAAPGQSDAVLPFVVLMAVKISDAHPLSA